jgi:hypothetical protein
MSDIVIRTAEQDLEFAQMVFRLGTQAPAKPIKEAYYAIKNQMIYEYFPDLKYSRLKTWCMNGEIGRMGDGKKYYVTLSEIEKKLWNR